MNNYYQNEICKLGIKNQILLAKAINFGMKSEIHSLVALDSHLSDLYIKSLPLFNFYNQLINKNNLFVGEGNFSFSLSISKELNNNLTNFFSTTLESESEISEETEQNIKDLIRLGASVLFNFDGTQIEEYFRNEKFDNIVFQFPNAGSREPVEERNPNFILLRDFLISAHNNISTYGSVIVTIVNSSYYDGAFSFDEAAEIAGFNPPQIYKFDPKKFPSYNHIMTNEDESALESHKSFKTLVFKK